MSKHPHPDGVSAPLNLAAVRAAAAAEPFSAFEPDERLGERGRLENFVSDVEAGNEDLEELAAELARDAKAEGAADVPGLCDEVERLRGNADGACSLLRSLAPSPGVLAVLAILARQPSAIAACERDDAEYATDPADTVEVPAVAYVAVLDLLAEYAQRSPTRSAASTRARLVREALQYTDEARQRAAVAALAAERGGASS